MKLGLSTPSAHPTTGSERRNDVYLDDLGTPKTMGGKLRGLIKTLFRPNRRHWAAELTLPPLDR